MLSLVNVSLKLAENQILDCVTWSIQTRERIALVGRNGAGKSTLLKLLQQEHTPDSGQIQTMHGLRIAGLAQEVPSTQQQTVYHFLVSHLGRVGHILADYHVALQHPDTQLIAHLEQQIEAHGAWNMLPKIESMASRLGLTVNEQMQHLSGGMRRRALLASALIAEPELLLLDEPTNHLDVTTIEWLETYLTNYPGSVLFVTHDRQFLANLAESIVEIDRGHLIPYQCNYASYLDRREGVRLAEEKQGHLFDKRLAQEEIWIRQGVQARRTRNEGRVLRLKAMREAYRERRNKMGQVKTVALSASYSGKIVLDATSLQYTHNNRELIHDFSFTLTRGDKVGIIGPNGCGKTTLVRLLLGELTPTSGTIQHGTGLEVAYFDQLRNALDERQTVMANVADGADFVTINGKKQHVAGYLRDFLFAPERFNQPVFSLSGGERNRLMLAKLLAKPVNLLVMDEPTNDLDIETLELLESILTEYSGTLLLISHDRAFVDQVVSSILVHEGHGHFNEYVGGYSDYQSQHRKKSTGVLKSTATVSSEPSKSNRTTTRLNYREKQELDALPLAIETLETQIQSMHAALAEPEWHQQPSPQRVAFNTQLAALERELTSHYARWEQLESKST